MKNWTPYLIAIAVVLYLGGSFVSQEYANIRNAIGETKQKADSVADETKQTIESIRQTIDDLRSKFNVLETQLSGKQEAEQKPIDDVGEVDNQSRVVMHSASWCGPCQLWKRDYLPQWEAQGWQVDVIEDDATTRSVPWFEIYYRGKRYEAVGLLDKTLFEKVIR
jgi:hypothetical protein